MSHEARLLTTEQSLLIILFKLAVAATLLIRRADHVNGNIEFIH
jgi:hypothetical protein